MHYISPSSWAKAETISRLECKQTHTHTHTHKVMDAIVTILNTSATFGMGKLQSIHQYIKSYWSKLSSLVLEKGAKIGQETFKSNMHASLTGSIFCEPICSPFTLLILFFLVVQKQNHCDKCCRFLWARYHSCCWLEVSNLNQQLSIITAHVCVYIIICNNGIQ